MAGANETYTIDIQAALPEGASVATKLDSLTKSLMGAEQSASFFEAATKQVGAALSAAKAATADANTALDAGNAQWAELEANALRAAKALEKASAKGAVPSGVAEQAETTKRALDEYAVTLAALESTAADARTSEQALGIAFTQTAAAAREAEKAAKAPTDAANAQAEAYGKLRGSLATLPGPLGKLASGVLALAQGFQKLAGSMGAARAAAVLFSVGAAALALAVAAVSAALVIGAVKLAAWAVGLADAARASGLATEAFNAMNPALASLDFAGLANETGLVTSELQGLAKSLDKAGVGGDRIGKSLRVAALAAKGLGASAAQEYVGLEQAATDAQKAVDDAAKHGGKASKDQRDALKKARAAADEFAATAQMKLGGIVARQMMGLDAQSERFSRNIDGLFGGLDIDPVLEGMRILVALFDKNTAAGAALKFLFETVFQPLIDMAKTAALAIEAFYLGVLIGAVKLYIAIKPTIKAIEEFFGLDSTELSVSFETITKAGEYLAPVFALIATVIGVTLVAAIAAVGLVLSPVILAFVLITKTIQGTIAAVGTFVDIMQSVVAYLKSVDLSTLGTDLIMGLVRGISSAAGAVASAVTRAVGGAIQAAKNMLGIASPSKVFASIGEDTAEGFAGGVEDSSDAAHSALTSMVSPQAALSGLDAAGAPPGPGALAAAPTGGAEGAAGARTITLYNPVIQLGAGTPKEQAQEFVTWITELLEGDAAQAAGA